MKRGAIVLGGLFLSLFFSGPVMAEYDCWFYAENGFHSWIQTYYAEPTCDEVGEYDWTCEYCGILDWGTIPSIGHDWHWIVLEDSTCIKEGLGAAECWNCGMRMYEPIQPGDHEWADQGIVQQATCTQNAVVRQQCIYCGSTRDIALGMADHVYDDWRISRASTDHSQGTRSRTCINCGNTISESFYPEGTLRRGGDNNTANVKEIQQILVDLHYLNDKVDGIYGGNTEAAVKAFQAANQLSADGICWPQTFAAIQRVSTGESVSDIRVDVNGEGQLLFSEEAVYSLSQLRSIAASRDAVCSIAYLGAYTAEYKDLPTYLEVAGVSYSLPFLTEIPEEHFLTYEGDQLYCIVPTDEQASVAVNQWVLSESNDYTGETRDVIYRSDAGDPIYIRGNISDIMPNMQVIIVDSQGRSVEYYPFMSLEDNTLEMPNGGGVLDFTPYGSRILGGYSEDLWEEINEAQEEAKFLISGENPADLIGDWAADSVYTEDGVEYNGTITFNSDGTMEFAYGKSDDIYEYYYIGSWIYYETAEEYESYSGTTGFGLNRTADSSADAPETIGGQYMIVGYGEDIISIALLEGDFLFPMQYWNDVKFTRAVG